MLTQRSRTLFLRTLLVCFFQTNFHFIAHTTHTQFSYVVGRPAGPQTSVESDACVCVCVCAVGVLWAGLLKSLLLTLFEGLIPVSGLDIPDWSGFLCCGIRSQVVLYHINFVWLEGGGSHEGKKCGQTAFADFKPL